jgi:hypothetical protein
MHPDTAWNIVVSFLHHTGDKFGQITPEQEQRVRCFANGFGRPAPQSAEFWEWKHIRYSTELAVERMARKLLALAA